MRNSISELLYLISQNVPGVVPSLGFLACYQLAVDLFPVRARATSTAVIVSVGRVASILAPFLYEAFAAWQSFYILMVILCMVTLVLTLIFLPGSPADGDMEPLCSRDKGD